MPSRLSLEKVGGSVDGLATFPIAALRFCSDCLTAVPEVLLAFFAKIAWPANIINMWQHFCSNRADFIWIRKDIFVV